MALARVSALSISICRRTDWSFCHRLSTRSNCACAASRSEFASMSENNDGFWLIKSNACCACACAAGNWLLSSASFAACRDCVYNV